jgi:splicing factor 3B subunit 2
LYTVLPQKDQAVKGFMGSQHTYDLSAVAGASAAEAAPPPPPPTDSLSKKRKSGIAGLVVDNKKGVELALNPEDLEEGLGGDAVRRAYEDTVAAHSKEARGEDFSDLVAEHASRQAKKRKKAEDTKKDGKKEKEKFKF